MTVQQYHLSDYPRCIEPTAEILEVTGGTTPANTGWVQLYRVPTPVVLTRLSGLPAGIVRFFALSSDLSPNQFLLGYTCAGMLQNVILRDEKHEWFVTPVPLESVGAPVAKPSVRLVFHTTRARAAFLSLIQQIINKTAKNPTLALIVEQLAEPPRLLDVWTNHE